MRSLNVKPFFGQEKNFKKCCILVVNYYLAALKSVVLKRMKTNRVLILNVFMLAALSAGVSSCSKSSSKNVSTATGWNIDGKDGAFKYNSKFKQQETPIGMVAVEGGTFTMGKVQDDPMHDWNNTPNQQHVQSFFMDEAEVTNMMYTEYLYYIKKVFSPDEENYKNIYKGALPDTLVWRDRLGYNEQMVTQYLRHPAYGNYPVVGVNWIQASEFCKWRTDFYNMSLLERERYLKKGAKLTELSAETYFSTEGYLMSPSTSFGGDESIVLKKPQSRASRKDPDSQDRNVYANMETGVLSPEFRLPTEAEWEYAALGLGDIREYNLYRGKKKYPWSGSYTRNSSRKLRGDQLANYQQGKGNYGGPAGWSSDGGDITVPVKSYPPNAFGLYDMAGNVNEWVLDVYRPIIDSEMNDFNYYRGNVYMKNEIDSVAGTPVFVTVETIKYDTLPDGKLIARALPGQISKVPIGEEETYLRYNFDKSDNRNFNDGDMRSTRYFDFGSSEDGQEGLKPMYNSPQHRVTADSLGRLQRNWDKSSKRTTLVNDESRVYKGGSWRDRAYWLDPAQRRYFPQYMATDDIGFRCAMSKAGPKVSKKKPRG